MNYTLTDRIVLGFIGTIIVLIAGYFSGILVAVSVVGGWVLAIPYQRVRYYHKKVLPCTQDCVNKVGAAVLCDNCLINRDGWCEHNKVTGHCRDCYEKQR